MSPLASWLLIGGVVAVAVAAALAFARAQRRADARRAADEETTRRLIEREVLRPIRGGDLLVIPCHACSGRGVLLTDDKPDCPVCGGWGKVTRYA